MTAPSPRGFRESRPTGRLRMYLVRSQAPLTTTEAAPNARGQAPIERRVAEGQQPDVQVAGLVRVPADWRTRQAALA